MMSDTMFRYFFRINFPGVVLSNEDLDELFLKFNDYLSKQNFSEELKAKIIPQTETEVMNCIGRPLTRNGFDWVLILHFDQFISEYANKAGK